MSASVLIDDKNNELTNELMDNLRAVISSAIGLNPQRGDSLVVQSMRFSTAFADAMAEELRQERLWRIISGSVIFAVLLLFVLAAVLLWLKRRRDRMAVEEIQAEGRKVPTIQEMLTSPDLLAFQGELAVLEEQLKAYARNNPEEVANLVTEWLAADES